MYTSKLHILSILPLESGPLVSLLLRITAVQTSMVAATVCEFVHGGPARNTHVTCLRPCDERTRINKSLVQALESCPSSDVTLPAVLPTLVPPLGKIRSQLA